MGVHIFEFGVKLPKGSKTSTLLAVTVEILANTEEEALEIFDKEIQIRDRNRFKSKGSFDKQLHYYEEH